jgi:hypothetical protein
MRRFELLRHLYACGLNDFNVYRLADITEVQRFPVFPRAEDGHEGSLTPLLHCSEQLERAIARGKSRDNTSGWVTPAEVLPFPRNSCSFRCRSHAEVVDSYLVLAQNPIPRVATPRRGAPPVGVLLAIPEVNLSTLSGIVVLDRRRTGGRTAAIPAHHSAGRLRPTPSGLITVERRRRRRPARQPAGSPRLVPSCRTLRRMLTEPQTPVRPSRRAAA